MRSEHDIHLGIDYGSRFAGTTAIVWMQSGQLNIAASAKKEDADKLISNCIEKLKPNKIFIDAPLSLPSGYYQETGEYFFRAADKEVSAMSPMFLGGLTARAMQLRYQYKEIDFYESYPKQLAVLLNLMDCYKSNSRNFLDQLNTFLPVKLKHDTYSWHQLDATLAWYTGWRYLNGMATEYGILSEGIIIA